MVGPFGVFPHNIGSNKKMAPIPVNVRLVFIKAQQISPIFIVAV